MTQAEMMEKLAEREQRRSERLARMVIFGDFSEEPRPRAHWTSYDDLISALDVRRIE